MASKKDDGSRVASSASGSSSVFSWRNPPPEKMKKFGLIALGDDFEPTPQEQRLLDMYETIKAYEKRAAHLKKDAALRKLQERNADFLQQQEEKKKKNKRKRAGKAKKSSDDEDDDDDATDATEEEDDDDDIGDDDEEEMKDDSERLSEQRKHEKREAKLEKLRQEVAEAEEKVGVAAKEQEEQMIAEHLEQNDEDMSETVVLRKKPKRTDEGGPSLLANLGPMVTPPHEFSTKLGLDRGKVLFPPPEDEDDPDDLMGLSSSQNQNQPNKEGLWEPPEGAIGPNDGAFLAYLEDFDMEAAPGTNTHNTLAIKFAVPGDSRRFSLNIAQADQPQHDFDSVLFHFNPRQKKGGQLVMNDKQAGVWGQALSIPLSQIPLMFGQDAITLQIQIHSDGFDVFVNQQHCARLEHRQDLLSSEHERLCVQFPSTDDYGSPESWKVYKVWWGYQPLLASTDASKLASVAGVNSFNSVHPRKLFVRGLPKIHSNSDVDIRRAELERAFRKYGGSRGIVKVAVYNHKTYATVELETERLADLALQEMSQHYPHLNRAKRTKHEALQEERLAKEQAAAAAKAGLPRNVLRRNDDWD